MAAAATVRAAPPVITGDELVICSQGARYHLVGAAPLGGYHWHLERTEATGPAAPWDGNPDQRSLTLAFGDGPGSYRLWVQTMRGESSNQLTITALASEPLLAPPDELPAVALETELPSASTMAAAALAADAPAGPAPAALPPAPADPLAAPLLAPDAEGLVDLVAAEPTPAAEPVPNPFRDRPSGPAGFREISLQVGAVLAGPDPAADCGIINGQLVSVGETIAGFTLAAVSADGVTLRGAHAAVLLPVQVQPFRLRLPR